MKASRLHVGSLIPRFHTGLEFDRIHIFRLPAGTDIEIGTQTCLQLKPIFVLALHMVYTTIAADVVAHSTIHLFIVFQRAHVIIFGE